MHARSNPRPTPFRRRSDDPARRTGCLDRADWLPPRCVRENLLSDEPQVIEVGQIEHLEVEPLRTGLDEGPELVEDLRGGAGQAVLPQLVDLAADRSSSPSDLRLRRAA